MQDDPITAAIRRSSQQYFEQVSERTTLSCGYAYTNPAYPHVPGCNFVGEVILDEDAPDPVAAVDGFFQSRGVRCSQWIPAAIQQVEPVARLVEPLGFRRRQRRAFVMPDVPLAGADSAGELRIVGGRAMRRAYTTVIARRSNELPQRGPQALAAEPDLLAAELTQVQLERLDDPQYDAFVALRGDEPVGVISVYQVGPIGRLCDLYVVPEARRQRVATALLRFAIGTARRWSLRPICMQVAGHNQAALALVARAGFDEAGTITTFTRPEVVEVGE